MGHGRERKGWASGWYRPSSSCAVGEDVPIQGARKIEATPASAVLLAVRHLCSVACPYLYGHLARERVESEVGHKGQYRASTESGVGSPWAVDGAGLDWTGPRPGSTKPGGWRCMALYGAGSGWR